jgi:hypothetical protein
MSGGVQEALAVLRRQQPAIMAVSEVGEDLERLRVR